MSIERVFEGLTSFADFLDERVEEIPVIIDLTAGLASTIVYRKVYDVVGDDTKLAELAEATQDERERLGFDRNLPLYRDGKLLRDSIERGHEGFMAGVGSERPEFAYQEFGFVNARTGKPVPPRPSFKIGLTEAAPEIEELLNEQLGVALGLKPMLDVKP